MGRDAADALRGAFRERRVRYKAPRRVRPEQRARQAERMLEINARRVDAGSVELARALRKAD